MNTADRRDEDELEMLLPWYLNGTLDAADAARVEAALATDPKLAHSLAVLAEEAEAVSAISQADMPPASMEARFLAQLAREAGEGAPAPRSHPSGMASRFGAWLAAAIGGMTPPRVALAAAAAALVIVVQAGVLVALLAQPDGPRLASGDEDQPRGPTLIVQLNGAAPVGEVAAFLDEIGARIVDGPSGGLFTLGFSPGETRDIAELAQILRDRPAYIRLVLPGGS